MTADTHRASKHAKRNLTLLNIFNYSRSIRVQAPVWLLFCQSIGVSVTQMGVLATATLAVMLVVDTPSSYLADRYGYKFMLCFGGLGRVASFFAVFFFVHSFGQLLWCWAFLTLCESCVSGAFCAFARDNTDLQAQEDDPALANLRFGTRTIRHFTIWMVASAAICGVIMWANPENGPRLVFFWQGVLTLPFALFSWRLTEPSRPAHKTKATSAHAVTNMWPLITWGILLVTEDYVCTFLTQPYLKEMGVPEQWFAAVPFCLYALMGITTFSTIPMFKRLGWQLTGQALLLSASLMMLCFGLLPKPWGFIGFIIMGVQFAGFEPIRNLVLTSHAKPSLRATVLSLVATGGGLLGSTLSAGAGWIVDHYSAKTAFLAVGCIYTLLSLPLSIKLKGRFTPS